VWNTDANVQLLCRCGGPAYKQGRLVGGALDVSHDVSGLHLFWGHADRPFCLLPLDVCPSGTRGGHSFAAILCPPWSYTAGEPDGYIDHMVLANRVDQHCIGCDPIVGSETP
jgi:hypothetical protein